MIQPLSGLLIFFLLEIKQQEQAAKKAVKILLLVLFQLIPLFIVIFIRFSTKMTKEHSLYSNVCPVFV